MKIALLGYGKMGKTIEKFALKKEHEIALKVDDDISKHNLENIDIAIDFSIPNAAFKNITTCFEHGVPVVSGTTGWLDHYNKAVEICKKHDSAFIYASNFSLGVNIFFELNERLSKIMHLFPEYAASIEEAHHTQKLDAPSGTAITLAEQIIKESNYNQWKLENAKDEEIPITAKRIENVPGTHLVTYKSEVDSIEIKHTAHSRDGFAKGAVVAAEWLQGKKGVFGMKDVLF